MTPVEIKAVVDALLTTNLMVPLLKVAATGILGFIFAVLIQRIASYFMFIVSDLHVGALVRESNSTGSEVGRIISAQPLGRIHIEFEMMDGSKEVLKVPMGEFSKRNWRVITPKR